MKKLGIFLLIVVVGVLGWLFYREPYRTYAALKTAAAENDISRFQELVDESAVRADLSEDLKSVVNEVTAPVPENAYTRLARSLVDKLLTPLIDPIVTPQGLHQLLTQGRLDASLYGLSTEKSETDSDSDDLLANAPVAPRPAASNKKEKEVVLTESMGYDSIGRFKVRLEAEGQIKPVILTFERDGIWSWQLVRIGFGL